MNIVLLPSKSSTSKTVNQVCLRGEIQRQRHALALQDSFFENKIPETVLRFKGFLKQRVDWLLLMFDCIRIVSWSGLLFFFFLFGRESLATFCSVLASSCRTIYPPGQGKPQQLFGFLRLISTKRG